MPRRFFEHRCRDNRVHTINISPCNICGAPGVYSGWGYSGIESMGHYKRLYGLPPVGPHRPFVDGLRLTEHCTACEGIGLFDIEHGRDYVSCPECDGVGRRVVCSSEDLQAVQQIAGLVIEHKKRSASYARDRSEPIDQVLELIADEPLRMSARRLLEERRFTDFARILTWQGILDPITTPGMACEPDAEDEDEDDEEFACDKEDNQSTPRAGQKANPEAGGPYRRPDPPSIEEITRELDRLRDLGLLGD